MENRSEVELFKLTAMIPLGLMKAIKIAAVEDGRPLREIIIESLEAHLKERRKKGGHKK